MAVAEFQIRAWQKNETQAQILVHSSPVGDIRKPITVPCNLPQLNQSRQLFQTSWFNNPSVESQLIGLGRQLANVLMPRPVYALLASSLQTIGPDSTLRLRLCLDSALVDLPWEYLYRPDVEETASLAGFLLLDHRISLVREAPLTASLPPTINEKQHMVFAGALWSDGKESWDFWNVQGEYQQLANSLAAVKDFLDLQFISAAGDIEQALAQPTAIFHYSGHTDMEGGTAYLVREVIAKQRNSNQPDSFNKLYSFDLANVLQKARTRLAVFSACNSGRWAFVEPLLRAGLPALIGAQGVVSVQAAYTFCESLYAKLAVGLSLDDALIGARFQLLKEGGFNGRESLEWGVFMAYMPATEAVLLPTAADQANAASLQDAARQRTQQAMHTVTGRIGALPPSASGIDQTNLRKAIVQAFSFEEEALLCADIQQDLKKDGLEINLDLDALGGREQGEEALVLKLIGFLDRRGVLSYLVDAVRQERPGLI